MPTISFNSHLINSSPTQLALCNQPIHSSAKAPFLVEMAIFKSIASAALMAAVTQHVQAQDYGIDCAGESFPKWDDCKFDYFRFSP